MLLDNPFEGQLWMRFEEELQAAFDIYYSESAESTDPAVRQCALGHLYDALSILAVRYENIALHFTITNFPRNPKDKAAIEKVAAYIQKKLGQQLSTLFHSLAADKQSDADIIIDFLFQMLVRCERWKRYQLKAKRNRRIDEFRNMVRWKRELIRSNNAFRIIEEERAAKTANLISIITYTRAADALEEVIETANLTQNEREVIEHWSEHGTLKPIADKRGVRVTAVQSDKDRALKKLREEFARRGIRG